MLLHDDVDVVRFVDVVIVVVVVVNHRRIEIIFKHLLVIIFPQLQNLGLG